MNETIVISGKEATSHFQTLSMRAALRIEVKFPGMRHSRGSVMMAVKRKFPQFKGRTKKVILEQLEQYIVEKKFLFHCCRVEA